MRAPEGFVSFYRQEYVQIVLYLRKLGANASEAEDCAQEAMIQALKAWERLTAPRAWVRRAAYTCFVRRAERARKEASLHELSLRTRNASDALESEHCPEQWYVVAIMQQLPTEQRKVAALFYDGFTYEEISEVLGKPMSTVRSLVRHARNQLKEAIQTQAYNTASGTS